MGYHRALGSRSEMSALPPKADILFGGERVHDVPKADMALVYRASKKTLGQPGRKDPDNAGSFPKGMGRKAA
jgi:hypothetical protein